MKLINWVQFTWDLQALVPYGADLTEHYEIAPATSEDDKELQRVITSSFTLDPDWNSTMHELMQTVDSWLEHALGSEMNMALVLRHGARIIGASVVSLQPDAETHLSPGPCILMEYRNRGFGTKILERSLLTLKEAGLTRAIGLAKENSPVTKFLYPKFGGNGVACDAKPLLAA